MFSIDSKIEYADQLLEIDDTGDYLDEYGIEDSSKEILPYLMKSSIVKGTNFLYNESIFTDYRDITRYSRQRLLLKKNEEIKEKDACKDFEWSDFMDYTHKKLEKRLDVIKFEDIMKINSGKISDKELNFILNDPRKIKTDQEMNTFLEELLQDINKKKLFQKKKKEEIKKLNQENEDSYETKVKKGLGSLVLYEMSKKKTGVKLDKTQTSKFQDLFNTLIVGMKIKEKYKNKSQRESMRELSNDSFMEKVDLKAGVDMYNQIVNEIDKKIDSRYSIFYNIF